MSMTNNGHSLVSNNGHSLVSNWRNLPPQERDNHLLMSGEYADVIFKFGNEISDRIKAHKMMLAKCSEVFHAMFYGQMAMGQMGENNKHLNHINHLNDHNHHTEKDIEQISVPDCDGDAFMCMLKFIYTDERDINTDNMINVIYVTKKYQILPLFESAVEFAIHSITDNNCLDIWRCKNLDERLEIEVITFIESYATDVFVTSNFKKLTNDELCEILELDNVIKEIDLFNAVINWAEEECKRQEIERNGNNMRNVIGPALKMIRFPIMSIDDFMSINVNYRHLLNDSEIVSIMNYIVQKYVSDDMPFTIYLRKNTIVDKPPVNTCNCEARLKALEKLIGELPQKFNAFTNSLSNSKFKNNTQRYDHNFQGSMARW